jgi:hypothetical protein
MLRGLLRVLPTPVVVVAVMLALGVTVAGLATCESDTARDMWIDKDPDAGAGFVPPEPEGGTSPVDADDAGGSGGTTGSAGTTGAAGTTGSAGTTGAAGTTGSGGTDGDGGGAGTSS